MGDDGSIYFRLDGRDRILEAGGPEWDRFARDNGGEAAFRQRVEGSDIFAHVCGETTIMFLRVLLDGVRVLGRPVTRAYRCDSPDLKRFMTMTITPVGTGGRSGSVASPGADRSIQYPHHADRRRNGKHRPPDAVQHVQ